MRLNSHLSYAEIGATLSAIAFFGGGAIFLFPIWLSFKYCEQMLIDEIQLSCYYNIQYLVTRMLKQLLLQLKNITL